MELDELCKHINLWCQYQGSTYISIIHYCELLIWIVGILGNYVNIRVFRHKNMAQQPISLIFWWLSINDLLELTILALYQWGKNWNGDFFIINIGTIYETNHIYDFVRWLMYGYLFLVFHTITIGLNIVLVFYQYKVVAYPLKNHKDFLNNRSIKFTVICMYILSFVIYLPYWYIYEIHHEEENRWMYRTRDYTDPLAYVCVVLCGMVLRIGPLVILIILCSMLLFAMKNAHHQRQELGMEARHQSNDQRNINRMNVTIIVIMLMFFITEVPLGMESFFYVSDYSFCQNLLQQQLLFPFILLNCSYSIFCYLLRIKQYRQTLKLLLSKINWVSCRTHVVEQTDLELSTSNLSNNPTSCSYVYNINK